jgi:hypothetical protein
MPRLPIPRLPMLRLPMAGSPRSINSAGYGDKFAGGWLDAAMADPDLPVIVVFCAFGLLVTLGVMFRFPDFVTSLEQMAPILG